MGSWFVSQLKRMLRYLPGAICAVLVLALGLSLALGAMTKTDNQRVRIAMVGTAGDEFLQMGLTALRSFDSTQFTLELLEAETEEEANLALSRGELSAYMVVPDNFLNDALNGIIHPIKMVTTAGSAGLVSIFKDEVSTVISDLLLNSQKGVYGMQQAMADNDIGGRGEQMTLLALKYAEYILARDRMYTVEELGAGDDLPLAEYLLCGLTVLLLLLCCLPFAPMVIRRDHGVARMLSGKGKPAWLQALLEFLAYFMGVLAVTALVGVLLGQLAPLGFAQLLPVAVLVAAFSFMLYAVSADLIGGVLLQFFVTAAMCFVSGCVYPVYFFPVTVQRLAVWLPAGVARAHLASAYTGEGKLSLILAYSAAFCAVGILARVRAAKEAKV